SQRPCFAVCRPAIWTRFSFWWSSFLTVSMTVKPGILSRNAIKSMHSSPTVPFGVAWTFPSGVTVAVTVTISLISYLLSLPRTRHNDRGSAAAFELLCVHGLCHAQPLFGIRFFNRDDGIRLGDARGDAAVFVVIGADHVVLARLRIPVEP